MNEFVVENDEYVIGVDLGLFEGDFQSLCIAHKENGVIVIDESFQQQMRKSMKRKLMSFMKGITSILSNLIFKKKQKVLEYFISIIS